MSLLLLIVYKKLRSEKLLMCALLLVVRVGKWVGYLAVNLDVSGYFFSEIFQIVCPCVCMPLCVCVCVCVCGAS